MWRRCDVVRLPTSRVRFPQPRQIGDGVLAAREHDEIIPRSQKATSSSQPSRAGESRSHSTSTEMDDGEPRAWWRGILGLRFESQAVFGVKMHISGVGKHPEAGRRRSLFENAHAFIEERHVATELVDHEPAKQRFAPQREQLRGTDDRPEDTATLDIGDQQPGRAESS